MSKSTNKRASRIGKGACPVPEVIPSTAGSEVTINSVPKPSRGELVAEMRQHAQRILKMMKAGVKMNLHE
jgi:hypothetical protein